MASPNTKRDVSKTYSDLYNTPDEAIEALMDYCHHKLDPNKTYFEPCNGKGNISNKVKDFGIFMETNELFSEHGESKFNEDFLNPDKKVSDKWDYDFIITNPPYKLATEFVNQGFKFAKEQYHLLRINFLEGQRRYESLMSKGHLKNVYIFTKRISCSKGIEEEPQANAVCYCWYHFDRDYDGLPTLHWI
ncbi:putative type I restriction-modification methylase [Vibrio phage vB_VpaM_R16F]|nr:putative type I restriction-modification methylase [Vibrio phage vB_VpaM_R16F]